MASKRKAGKKASKSSKRAGKKSTTKRQAQKRTNSKTSVKKKSVAKTAAKKKASVSSVRRSARSAVSRKGRNESRFADSREVSQESSRLQSGDLQGLSDLENVDSESVSELMDEGNAFEAGVVSGVEDSAAREGKEVRTREVPEDDVPGEYLDEE